jgi:alkylation response protein AidB-like acyl-CoA dehydrogenase
VVNGANADLCFVTCKLDGESTTVLIEKDRPGVSVPRVFDKLGTRAIDSAELLFDGVLQSRHSVSGVLYFAVGEVPEGHAIAASVRLCGGRGCPSQRHPPQGRRQLNWPSGVA